MDFRLKAFVSVARNLNFTKAARELHISQPAVSSHIKELETSYGVQLFDRMGSRVSLTTAGEVFLKHAESIIESYRALRLEMNLLSGNFSGTLRIGASTTIAQYAIPSALARFVSRFPDLRVTMQSGNSQQIEQALTEHRIDVGLVEGSSRHAGLSYGHYVDDELVLVTSARNGIKDEISVDELCRLPMVLRESGSGTLEVVENALVKHNVKLSNLNVLLQLGTTEGIKSFLADCPSAYAVMSISAVTKELLSNVLRVIDVEDLEMRREFAFVTIQGQHNDIVDRFVRFLSAGL